MACLRGVFSSCVAFIPIFICMGCPSSQSVWHGQWEPSKSRRGCTAVAGIDAGGHGAARTPRRQWDPFGRLYLAETACRWRCPPSVRSEGSAGFAPPPERLADIEATVQSSRRAWLAGVEDLSPDGRAIVHTFIKGGLRGYVPGAWLHKPYNTARAFRTFRAVPLRGHLFPEKLTRLTGLFPGDGNAARALRVAQSTVVGNVRGKPGTLAAEANTCPPHRISSNVRKVFHKKTRAARAVNGRRPHGRPTGKHLRPPKAPKTPATHAPASIRCCALGNLFSQIGVPTGVSSGVYVT